MADDDDGWGPQPSEAKGGEAGAKIGARR